MLRTVPAPEGIVQVLRQPLRFPGLSDPQIHSRLAFPELLCRFCTCQVGWLFAGRSGIPDVYVPDGYFDLHFLV